MKVSVSSVLNPDDGIIIFCNLTRRGNENSTPLKRISWFKDGKLLESVRNPDPDVQQDFLAPLKLTKVDVQQGGKYTCLLEVKLRHIKEYNVTDYTVIKSKYNELLQQDLISNSCYCLPFNSSASCYFGEFSIGSTNNPLIDIFLSSHDLSV